MFWSTPSIAAPHVLAAQIPRINGNIGGVPALNSTITNPILAAIVSDSDSAGQLHVMENSGVCGQPLISTRNIQISYAFSKETTPGVYQASGYGDLTSSGMNPPCLRPLLSHLIAFTGSGSSLPAKIQTLRRSLSGSMEGSASFFLFFSFALTNKS